MSDRRAELPSAVDSVIGRGLAKAPGDRFETCRELIAQTQAALAPAAKRRRVRAAVIAAIAAAALGVVGLPLVFTGGSDPRPRTGYLERIDPASGDVNATYPLSEHPGRIAASGGRVWTVDLREGALWRLDAARGDLLRLPSVGNPRDVAILGGDAYVADDSFATFSGNVTRYDAATGQRKGGLALLACAIAAGDRVVWAAGCPNIERLDFSGTGVRVVARQEIPLPRARSAGHDRTLLQDMAIGEGALWVLGDATDPRVWKIERATGRILATTALPFAPRSIAAGAGGVWISGGIADVVARLDPRDGRLLTLIHVGRGASGVTTGAGRVWVATALDGAVSEIDAVTSRVVRTIHVGGLPRELAYAEHALWVAGDAR